MDQKGLFEEEGKFEGDELKDMIGKFGSSQKGDAKVLLLVLLLIVGAYAGYVFYLKKEEPAAPPPALVKMPIKGAPVMANVTGAKATPVKEAAKAEEKKGKAEAEKPAEVKIAQKEEAAKAKPEVRAEKPAQKEAAQAEIKKAEAKAKVEAEAKRPAGVKIAQKEVKETKEKTAEKISKERHVVVVGTYAAKYAVEEAREKLKGKGIRSSSREVKKKLTMSRIFVKEIKKKEEARALLSELKGKGYEPFLVLANGVYKVYAVSNMNEDIARENKADLEKLGYQPVIEKKVVDTKVYELVVRAKSAAESKTLSAKLKKIGFKPEIRN